MKRTTFIVIALISYFITFCSYSTSSYSHQKSDYSNSNIQWISSVENNLWQREKQLKAIKFIKQEKTPLLEIKP